MDWSVNRSVSRVLKRELTAGLGEPGTMVKFVGEVKYNLGKLSQVVADSNNQPIDIYGASTRGAVLWQAAGIDCRDVSFAVERQEEKVGKWFSPIGVQIISEEEMRATPPQSLLVGPWWHRESFIEREAQFLKDGGRMIFPLPQVEVVSG
jgi:NDP-4-keto-2,6-dideoxyhexose 3-C-methyltransferase